MPADLETILSVYGGMKAIERVLGPTFDYLGDNLRTLAQKRIENLGRIFNNANRKLGDQALETGSVPPRVLKGILDEGSFTDDFLAAEYFGGVLASSRSGVQRDDRGASFINLLSGMSSYQVRAHYIFYSLFKTMFDGQELHLGRSDHRMGMWIFVPKSVFVAAMDFTHAENVDTIVSHVMHGLQMRDLFSGERWHYGDVTDVFEAAETPGIIVAPSNVGAELYLWAYGRGDLGLGSFLDESVALPLLEDITILPGAEKLRYIIFPGPKRFEPHQ